MDMDKLKDGTQLHLQTFELFEKPYSLNEYRNENHYKLNQIKIFWSMVVINTLRIKKIKPVKRANLSFVFNFKTKIRRDADNMVATVKFIMDALVKDGILADDSFQFVEQIQISKGELKKDCITVQIWGEMDAHG